MSTRRRVPDGAGSAVTPTVDGIGSLRWKQWRGSSSAIEASTGGRRLRSKERSHRPAIECSSIACPRAVSAGDDWEHRLYDELYRSDVLVALVSASYVQSQWCFAELAIARARGLFILPVALEAGLRHPLLANVQHLDVGGDLSASGERLLSRLRELEGISAIGWSSDRPLYAAAAAAHQRRRQLSADHEDTADAVVGHRETC